MADGATTNDLVGDNGAVRASGGTIQLPQPLAAGSWGFAVAATALPVMMSCAPTWLCRRRG